MPVITMPNTPDEVRSSPSHSLFGAEVLHGLSHYPKTLPPWLLYDEKGSTLFEAITELPEYYLTRLERDIFLRHGDEMVAMSVEGWSSEDCRAGGGELSLIELGAGAATKTGLLLEAAVRRQGRVAYYPIDISQSALEEAKARLEAEFEGVAVYPILADYTRDLAKIESGFTPSGRKLALYIGSSIGNFDPPEALDILRGLRSQLVPGDTLLLGVDMVKDRQALLSAYDDAAGVTAAFNKNLLVRINRELGADFHSRRFAHKAVWNEPRSRMEMHLESLSAQKVSIPALDLRLCFTRGETIHTENSYKFTDHGVRELISAAEFDVRGKWTDEAEWFAVYLAAAV